MIDSLSQLLLNLQHSSKQSSSKLSFEYPGTGISSLVKEVSQSNVDFNSSGEQLLRCQNSQFILNLVFNQCGELIEI